MAPESTILLTGANGGLGTAIVESIMDSPDLWPTQHCIFVARKAETAYTLKDILRGALKRFQREIVSIDLSRLSSVRQAAKDINRRVAAGEIPPIRALLISAGFQEMTTQDFTEDGYDMTFQVNYLAQFLLVILLLESMDKEQGRIVIVSGAKHEYVHGNLPAAP